MKKGLHLAGVEDGSFEAFPRKKGGLAVLCCAEMVGEKIEKVILSSVEVDGLDATEKLSRMLEGTRAEAVILGGITFAGFNIINPMVIHQETHIPIIICSRDEPDNDAMLAALRGHFKDWEDRWRIVESLGVVHKTVPKAGEPPLYFEVVGGSTRWAEDVLGSSAIVCRIPEPVRVARLIARGVSQV